MALKCKKSSNPENETSLRSQRRIMKEERRLRKVVLAQMGQGQNFLCF